MKYKLKVDVKVKIPYFNSVLIIKAGSKCVPQANERSTIFMVQPYGSEEKEDNWIRVFGYRISKNKVITIEE